MEPTPQQQAIFENVAHGSGHTVIVARAGVGKTTTALEALKHVPADKSVLVVAFGRIIADELKARAPKRPGLRIATCHALGKSIIHRAVPGAKFDAKRAVKLAKRYSADSRSLMRLVSLAKASLANTITDFVRITLAHGLDYGEDLERFVQNGFAIWNACADQRDKFDFDDMIWWPYELQLEHPKYDFVFVDELQDLSPSQVEMTLACCAEGGRIVGLGDPAQAIYGFRGAGHNSVQHVQQRLKASQLPLTLSFRCSRTIVEQAQRFVPDFNAAPGAHIGLVRHASEDELLREAAPGDFVVSRLNAPLVPLVWALVRAGKPAVIRGRDIGEGLAALIRKVGGATTDEMRRRLNLWMHEETQRLLAQDPPLEDAAMIVRDKVSCILALSHSVDRPEHVARRAQELFDDDTCGRIVLSTTHKAKGLEANRVWVLRDTYLKRPGREENNLMYVAITRAKNELVYVASRS